MRQLSVAARFEFERLQGRHPLPLTYRDVRQARRVLDELAGRVRYESSGGFLTASLVAGPGMDPSAPFEAWRR